MGKVDGDPEAQAPTRIPHFRQILDQGVVTPEIIDWPYKGSGTDDDPYIVTWIDNDPRNPMNYSELKKWLLMGAVALATLAVSFISSAYSGGVGSIESDLDVSAELAALGLSLFVLGFAVGPLIWGPFSELYGRQRLFIITYLMLTVFNAAAAGSPNIQSLLVFRFLAGAWGSSPLTNAGGVIADLFSARKRGVAMTSFVAAPFLGPTLGPIVGGFVGETIGWRWIEGIVAIFSGSVLIMGCLCIPETYGPVLLRRRAQRLTKLSGKVYMSQPDADQGTVSLGHALKTSLYRPWVLLFREPIVILLTIYTAIVYGTLYMCFGAFPIVFQEQRGWSPGVGGLSFLGVLVGMFFAIAFAFWDNNRYIRAMDSSPGGIAPPEARLPPTMVGAVFMPIGLFWFAWTNSPSIPWIVCIIGTVPFGFGMVLVFLGVLTYLVDAYVIFAASVLAANSVLRSLFGFAFPLFTDQMYANLGIHWASSIPAFLALMCAPFPFVFYHYGAAIRKRCKFAGEADAFLNRMREKNASGTLKKSPDADDSVSDEDRGREKDADAGRRRESLVDEAEAEAFDYSYDDENEPGSGAARFQRIKSASHANVNVTNQSDAYEGSPFDLDRVNTADSFPRERPRSKASSRAASLTRSVRSKKSQKDLAS